MKARIPKSTREQGAVIIIGLVLLLVMFIIANFIIDLVRLQYVGRTMQRAVDAAALAGAQQFQKRKDPGVRWTDSLRAIFYTLRLEENRIFGFEGTFENVDAFIAESEELDLNSDKLPGETAGIVIGPASAPMQMSVTSGGQTLTLSIERGVYGTIDFLTPEALAQPFSLSPPVPTGFRFCPLEGSTLAPVRRFWPFDHTYCSSGAPNLTTVTMGANAVRLSLQLTGSHGWFRQVLSYVTGNEVPDIVLVRRTVSSPSLNTSYAPWARIVAGLCHQEASPCWVDALTNCPPITCPPS